MASSKTSKKSKTPKQSFESLLEGGYSYLIKQEENDVGTALLSQKELTKLPILYITRTAPEKVNENTNLNEKSMIWLTYNKGPNCIEPTNITRLSLRIQKFLKETKSGTIIFDGLEYLTSQNDFSTILHFIQLVNDKIMISDSKLILSINPSAFNPRELAQIERELEPMDNRLLIETQNTSK